MQYCLYTDPKDDDSEDESSDDSSDEESSDDSSDEESSDDELKPCDSCGNYGCDDEECKRDNTNR